MSIAASYGHANIVKVLLAADTDPASRVEAWTMTAQNSRHKIMDILAAAGVFVDLPLKWDCTALLIAVRNEDLEAVKGLLAAGADVNKHNDYGVTPLMMAANSGNEKILEMLLQVAGASSQSDEAIGS